MALAVPVRENRGILRCLLFYETLKKQLESLRVCPWPWENQAGGDTAQITDFAQTWHKCWVW